MARELVGTQGDNPSVLDQVLKAKPAHVQARNDMGIGLSNDPATRTGQVLGTLGSDVVQDRGRSVWWLLNAPQATANVLQEMGLHKLAPNLYEIREDF